MPPLAGGAAGVTTTTLWLPVFQWLTTNLSYPIFLSFSPLSHSLLFLVVFTISWHWKVSPRKEKRTQLSRRRRRRQQQLLLLLQTYSCYKMRGGGKIEKNNLASQENRRDNWNARTRPSILSFVASMTLFYATLSSIPPCFLFPAVSGDGTDHTTRWRESIFRLFLLFFWREF